MALAERVRGKTVAEALEARATQDPDRTFLISGRRRLSYRQVEAQATALAAALQELGIEAGDRIALDLPNWTEFIISLFAAAKLGAIIVPLNPRYTVPASCSTCSGTRRRPSWCRRRISTGSTISSCSRVS